jgi:two-component system, OmpR family, copper resistance phosphate regulon response regulator CusR
MRILSVEDNQTLRKMLKKRLSPRYAIDFAKDGKEGSYLARTNDYDLVLLDYVLPIKDGLDVCKDIRKAGKAMPILMVSGMCAIENKCDCIDAGADDYLCKPFDFNELTTRIRALLRRPPIMEEDILQVDDLILDTKRHIVTRGGKDIYLRNKEFNTLEYLMRNAGIVLSRGMILDHVWGQLIDPFSNTVNTHIVSIRKKIDSHSTHKLIQTVPGHGYRLSADTKPIKG